MTRFLKIRLKDLFFQKKSDHDTRTPEGLVTCLQGLKDLGLLVHSEMPSLAVAQADLKCKILVQSPCSEDQLQACATLPVPSPVLK